MFRLLKWFISFAGIIAVLCVILFGAMDVYFHKVNRIDERVRDIIMTRAAARHETFLSYDQIPVTFRDAVIATEDRRFYSDPGIDPIGIVRSIVVDVQRDGYVEGGSTITQQLVDDAMLGQQKTLKRKLLQAFYAIGLYDTMSKPEVFALYANDVYFGNGAYGLNSAAERYFGRSPAQLNEGELTMLAGIPNAPSVYDPYHSMQLARERQQIVLDNMVDDGMISSAEAKQIFAEPIRLVGAAGWNATFRP
ncbi:transglycosylase domain-containing protein [Alicyclobacillus cycloheptanicus]|uniref:peptidoglycan glycosyltransferase n=1 Tax=Alicyclobacillus cycloheptanicus TaxID=1457 RepID=A0ABT9XHL5_9BACL|nr:biosynthetic peptidoglycan transglycosylase [Alicyclobacillus cycloheptanicus]MDQ0189605.1 membrane peptidoglycan carboxypeptidase [Alicyclobacillus cycloheptanicus]WDL99915.1 transglycosylase domain-containing protein [Alicyclobacillus cycloheptanicus]